MTEVVEHLPNKVWGPEFDRSTAKKEKKSWIYMK
jgi:hypothetical protein